VGTPSRVFRRVWAAEPVADAAGPPTWSPGARPSLPEPDRRANLRRVRAPGTRKRLGTLLHVQTPRSADRGAALPPTSSPGLHDRHLLHVRPAGPARVRSLASPVWIPPPTTDRPALAAELPSVLPTPQPGPRSGPYPGSPPILPRPGDDDPARRPPGASRRVCARMGDEVDEVGRVRLIEYRAAGGVQVVEDLLDRPRPGDRAEDCR
jgi:hypothetical protein